jgi:predicted metal-dependent hydrolase
MEHYTAVIGEWLLTNDKLETKGMHPAMLDLIRWHGAEEVEHRSVVYDAYMYVDGGYGRKARQALIASTGLLALFVVSSGYLFQRDPSKDKGRFWPLQLASASLRGVVPNFATFFTEIPRYLKPGFHPSQLGPMDNALRYLAQSPATRAAGA